MVNSWSLLYDEMYGPEDEATFVKWNREKLEQDPNYLKWKMDNPSKSDYYFNYDRNDPDTEPPYKFNKSISFSDDPYPTVGAVDEAYKFHFPPTDKKPQPDLDSPVHKKYEEDKGMKDLSDYVSSTYQGHYTNDGSNVQTLDLIHSVGDAESFCRSNAIKYLSRYDKKGQAKRDILKAMHYCLLLYYFSGNTNNETPTRGYETF